MADTIIKFQMFGVKNATTGTQTRVFYSLDNHVSGNKCITLYDRDYGRALQKVFEGTGVRYRNDTDSMTDYFDKGQVYIFETDEIYAAARPQVEALLVKLAARRAANQKKREERSQARMVARLGKIAVMVTHPAKAAQS